MSRPVITASRRGIGSLGSSRKTSRFSRCLGDGTCGNVPLVICEVPFMGDPWVPLTLKGKKGQNGQWKAATEGSSRGPPLSGC